MASGKRIPFINVLRLLAMVFVLTPHLLAYQLENQVMIWVGTYVLNPLHIVQYCGALGVSLFFITSGYLTMPQAGTGRCVQRLYRQVLSLMVEVFAAMMFCMVVSYAFQALFTAINGHQGPYAAFTLRDWLASAVLYRNFMFRVSTEGILWFLVPFLMFKLGLILLDKPLRRLEQRGNGPWLFFGAVVLGFAIRALWPAFNYITERFFYMGIILMGYIFALLNHGRISKAKCALLQGVNLALMLFSLQMTQVGIDNGYIVSALYAAVLFYGCYKLRDSFHYNRFLAYTDTIGLPFFLLHYCVGVNFIQLIYYVFWNGYYTENHVMATLGLSTVLMLATPAKIAGCREIVLCTPPGRDGKVHPAILCAARVAGVNRIFKAGGVQAIGAMAYGTESVPKVYKIFGPGNQYVMAAKQQVSLHDVAIDMPAGPSEVAVLADAGSNPVFVAADLLSQAEHGVDSQVLLVTTDEALVGKVQDEVERQLAALPRKEIAKQALAHSKLVVVRDMDEALELTNRYAPEHLIIETADYLQAAERVVNAGSVFLGSYTPESAGDYASGTNHTLPTNGYATAYSGVNLDSYHRKITFQELTPQGIRDIGPAVELMAAGEHLDAHRNAMTVRLESIKTEMK